MISFKRLACSAIALLLLLAASLCWGTTVTSNGYTSTTSISGVDVLNSTYSPFSYTCANSNCLNELGTRTFQQVDASFGTSSPVSFRQSCVIGKFCFRP
jgi:hypothetical protein